MHLIRWEAKRSGKGIRVTGKPVGEGETLLATRYIKIQCDGIAVIGGTVFAIKTDGSKIELRAE